MLRILVSLAFCLAVSTSALAQNSGFSLPAPEGWHETTKSDLTENLGKFEMTTADAIKLLANNNGC